MCFRSTSEKAAEILVITHSKVVENSPTNLFRVWNIKIAINLYQFHNHIKPSVLFNARGILDKYLPFFSACFDVAFRYFLIHVFFFHLIFTRRTLLEIHPSFKIDFSLDLFFFVHMENSFFFSYTLLLLLFSTAFIFPFKYILNNRLFFFLYIFSLIKFHLGANF